MSDVIISVEHLSKRYRLGKIGAAPLRESESVNIRVNPWPILFLYNSLALRFWKVEATDLH
jgi:hypothetical protein